MDNFADQCLDMAQSILGHNLESISQQGTIVPVEGEPSRLDDSGHAALAIGEYFRATSSQELAGYDLVDLCARCVTAKLLHPRSKKMVWLSGARHSFFRPAKDRNLVWERLMEPTQEQIDNLLLERSDYENHFQSFNIAKAVTRFSLGLSKKDETGRLIDRFLERIDAKSSTGYFDESGTAEAGHLSGAFDLYGVHSFVFIRQALQLHANIHLRERKLPSMRTYSEKYLKIILDLVRQDGSAGHLAARSELMGRCTVSA